MMTMRSVAAQLGRSAGEWSEKRAMPMQPTAPRLSSTPEPKDIQPGLAISERVPYRIGKPTYVGSIPDTLYKGSPTARDAGTGLTTHLHGKGNLSRIRGVEDLTRQIYGLSPHSARAKTWPVLSRGVGPAAEQEFAGAVKDRPSGYRMSVPMLYSGKQQSPINSYVDGVGLLYYGTAPPTGDETNSLSSALGVPKATAQRAMIEGKPAIGIHELEHTHQPSFYAAIRNLPANASRRSRSSATRAAVEIPATLSETTYIGEIARRAGIPLSERRALKVPLTRAPEDYSAGDLVPPLPRETVSAGGDFGAQRAHGMVSEHAEAVAKRTPHNTYDPSLEWMRRQAVQHGHIGGSKTMTELLNTREGRQWLDMIIRRNQSYRNRVLQGMNRPSQQLIKRWEKTP